MSALGGHAGPHLLELKAEKLHRSVPAVRNSRRQRRQGQPPVDRGQPDQECDGRAPQHGPALRNEYPQQDQVSPTTDKTCGSVYLFAKEQWYFRGKCVSYDASSQPGDHSHYYGNEGAGILGQSGAAPQDCEGAATFCQELCGTR